MKFEQLLENTFLTPENEIHIPRESLCPNVFQFFEDGRPPILQDSIKAQILTDIQMLENVVPITNFYLIGDVLTPYYTDRSDMNIYVEIDPQIIDQLASAQIFYNLKRINGRYATGTRHKINYLLHSQKLDVDTQNAVYDIVNERWIKRPEAVSPKIQEFLTKFNETILSIDNETGRILRDRISITEIRKLSKADLETLRYYIQKKYDRLVENLEAVVQLFPERESIERLLNDNTLTILEIQLWGQRLPDFIRRMFYEKLHTIKFIQRLDDFLIDEDQFDIKALVNTNEMGKYFKQA